MKFRLHDNHSPQSGAAAHGHKIDKSKCAHPLESMTTYTKRNQLHATHHDIAALHQERTVQTTDINVQWLYTKRAVSCARARTHNWNETTQVAPMINIQK